MGEDVAGGVGGAATGGAAAGGVGVGAQPQQGHCRCYVELSTRTLVACFRGGQGVRPLMHFGVGQIGDEDRHAPGDGVQAGAFAKGELQLVEFTCGGPTGTQVADVGAVEDDRDRGACTPTSWASSS